MELLEAFKWRYATKKFDPTKKIELEQVDKIIEAVWLSPTSSGLQPFELLVITNQELKNKLAEASYGQQIVADCSHLLVFAAWDNYTEERIETIYGHITREREQPEDRYQAYKDRLKTMYLNRPDSNNFEHAARQAYIGMGFAMAEAASLRIDATPMEGFVASEVDAILDLPSKGLKSVLLLPIGYRDEANDWLVNQKKVRHPKSDFLTVIE
jgi:nitroreductase / dihydropteridine reductase